MPSIAAKEARCRRNKAESKKVDFKSISGNESVGHDSGKKTVVQLGKHEADYNDDDVVHARKVVGYIHRQLAQRPAGDITKTPWCYSLMNWGHDPRAGR